MKYLLRSAISIVLILSMLLSLALMTLAEDAAPASADAAIETAAPVGALTERPPVTTTDALAEDAGTFPAAGRSAAAAEKNEESGHLISAPTGAEQDLAAPAADEATPVEDAPLAFPSEGKVAAAERLADEVESAAPIETAPTEAVPAELQATYSGTCGANLTWNLNTSTGALTISGTGAMTDYSWKGAPWYSYRSSVKTVTIASGVTSIGYHAFDECSNITSIVIPNSIEIIEEWAFADCTSLNYTIYDNAYYLGNSDNPYLVLFKASNMAITSCAIHPNTKFINCIAFYGCSSLTSVTIPDSVTSIGDSAFSGCSSLTSVTIPDSVTSIGAFAFSGCSGLVYSVYDNAEYLGNDGNPYLALIKVSNTSIRSCTINFNTRIIAGYAFRNCANLTSINIPDNVRAIGNNAFMECDNLARISIGSGLTFLSSDFEMDGGLSVFGFFSFLPLMSIDVSENNTVYSSQDGVLFDKDKTTLLRYPQKKSGTYTIPDGITSIKNYAFSYCESLTSVTIPDGVTSIGEQAFGGCYSLTSVTIPDSVTSIGSYAFWCCSGLTSVTIPDSVTSIGKSAFDRCESLTSVIYCGTSAQWNKISIGSYNESLSKASRQYHAWDDGAVTTPTIYTAQGVHTYTCTICGETRIEAIGTAIAVENLERAKGSGTRDIDVTLTLTGNTGLAGAYMRLYYDSALKLKSVTKGAALPGLTFTPPGDLTANPIYLIWDGGNADATNGVLLKLTFTVPISEAKSFPITLRASSGAFYDDNIEDVDVTLIAGGVTVTPHTHSWDTGTVTTPATCTAAGTMTYACTGCDETYTETIPALGHDFIHHEAKSAICEEIGWAAYDTCSRCNYTTYVEIPALGHDYVRLNGLAPTCTAGGWAIFSCSRCNNTSYREYEALGHDLIHHDAQPVTCEAIGWDTYDTCSRCDYTTYEELLALGHDYQPEITTEPTCTADGVRTYTCKHDASHTYAETIPALGHDYVQTQGVPATCTEGGYGVFICSRCQLTKYEEYNAFGHDLIHHEAKAATCEEIGWDAYDTCSRCDYTTYAEIPALGHDLIHHEAQAPTHAEIGWEAYDTCSRCDYTTYVELEKLPFAPGDINGDGILNAKDVTALRRHLAGGYTISVVESLLDVNHDGSLNAKDVTYLRRALAGGYGITLE